ncbi:unnamed protein product [Paramecium octaurelia]|uniref:Transmembrane protein n=1 Tax=Paramecium octaurelia TaxID=43137 RepID=A0A8S1UGN7_PAROT|nr:unnamed protein product [Paramecium octaurelia]
MEKFLIFLGCLFYQIESITTKCEEINQQPWINCYQYIQNCLSLQGDEEDYSMVQNIDHDVLQKSFLIPYKKEPILTRIINNLDNQKIQEKFICSLFLDYEYYISCINFDLVFYEELDNYREERKFQTKISSQENCFEMFESNNGSFRIFCLGSFTLKQYQVNLQGITTIIQEHDASDQISDFCKIKQKAWNENYLILVFYRCSKWKVLMIRNQDVKIILAAQMENKETQLQSYSFIQDVSFCEFHEVYQIFYLVENFGYLKCQIYGNQSTLEFFSFKNLKRLQQVLLQKRCQNMIFIDQLEDNRTRIFGSQSFVGITLDQKFDIDNIHYKSDLIFLQNQFELKILIDTQINQTYQISNTSLHFFQFNNFFCQFDIDIQGLQFYKINPISPFIKPKKQYIFFILKDDLFRQRALIKCYKMINQTIALNQNQHLVYKLILRNACSNNLQTSLSTKSFKVIQDLSFNLNSNEGSIKVSIKNNQEIQESCFQRLYQVYLQGDIEFISMKLPRYISCQNKTKMIIYDCQYNQLIIQLNRDEFDVLESNENIYIFNKTQNHLLRVIKFHNNSIKQFNLKFDDVIIEAQKIAQNIFIYLKNSDLPLLILQNFEINGHNQYLIKSLYQNESIFFYTETNLYKVIQYPNLLVIENQGSIKCFKYLEGEIIFISQLPNVKDCLLFLTVQYHSRSLILSQFNDFEIHHLSNYSLLDYQFSNPLRYESKLQRLAILIKQNNSLFIAILEFDYTSLNMREIISTDNPFFKLTSSNLLYSSNKKWRYLYFELIFVDVSTQTPFQDKLSSNYQMYLNPMQGEDGGIEVALSIQNACYELQSLQNLSIIQIQKYQIISLNISDFFKGPISSLELFNNSNIKLNGPFQYTKKLKECNQMFKFCIKKYHFQFLQYLSQFKIAFLENEKFGISDSFLNNEIIRIFWIRDNYFLSIAHLGNKLYISLIQCSEKEDEICKLTTNVNETLQITQVEQLNIMRTGNLIQLYAYTFLYIQDINFAMVEIEQMNFDFSYIEQSQDYYIFFARSKINQNDLEIKIYQIQLNQKILIYSSIVATEFETEFTTKTENAYNYESKIKLGPSKQIGDEIIVKFLVFNKNENLSYLFLLEIQLKQKIVQFQFQNYIRNFIPTVPLQSNFIVDYLDDDILILKQDLGEQIKIYDLRHQREFYDYFHQSNNTIQIQRINTTHYIFDTHDGISLGTIGYEIQIEYWGESIYYFDIFAQNEISKNKVSFQIHMQQNQNYQVNIMLIQLICLFFLMFYLKNKRSRTRK